MMNRTERVRDWPLIVVFSILTRGHMLGEPGVNSLGQKVVCSVSWHVNWEDDRQTWSLDWWDYLAEVNRYSFHDINYKVFKCDSIYLEDEVHDRMKLRRDVRRDQADK